MKMISMIFALVLASTNYVCAATLHAKVTNQIGMIGVRIASLSKTISKVYPNSPAYYAGLKKGDKVLKIDDKHTNIDYIDGEPYTYVQLTVRRGKENLTFDVYRREKDDVFICKEKKEHPLLHNGI